MLDVLLPDVPDDVPSGIPSALPALQPTAAEIVTNATAVIVPVARLVSMTVPLARHGPHERAREIEVFDEVERGRDDTSSSPRRDLVAADRDSEGEAEPAREPRGLHPAATVWRRRRAVDRHAADDAAEASARDLDHCLPFSQIRSPLHSESVLQSALAIRVVARVIVKATMAASSCRTKKRYLMRLERPSSRRTPSMVIGCTATATWDPALFQASDGMTRCFKGAPWTT